MLAYIIRRLLLMIPTLFGIMAISFLVIQFAPGGPVEQVIANITGQGGGATDRISGGGADFSQFDAGSESNYRGAQGLDPEFIAQLERQFGFVDLDRAQELHHVLDHLDIPAADLGKGVADFQKFMVDKLKKDRDEAVSVQNQLIDVTRANLDIYDRVQAAVLGVLEARSFEEFIEIVTHDFAVIMDVVYNHIGPEGNYLGVYGPYFTDFYSTPWGEAINYDQADSDEVRAFALDNAAMWLRDYHVDGLRLDAVHAIIDTSATHLLEEMATMVEGLSAELGRPLTLIAESDQNDPRLCRPRDLGVYGVDAQWSDDFHHALRTTLTVADRLGPWPTVAVAALALVTVLAGALTTLTGRRGRIRSSLRPATAGVQHRHHAAAVRRSARRAQRVDARQWHRGWIAAHCRHVARSVHRGGDHRP